MKTKVSSVLASLSLPCLLTLSAAAAETPSLEPLQGKWMTTKTNREGRSYSQIIEIKKDGLTLQIFNADEQLRLVADGTVKTEKNGPFDVMVVTNTRAGRSVADMQPLDDTRALIYAVRDGKLYLASNFDKDRNNEKPGMDVYILKAAATTTSAVDAAKLLGSWKMSFEFGDNTLDYELRFAKTGNSVEGILVSPRSGEHKCKSVALKDGEFTMEVEREIQGNEATFVYTGKLTADGLTGKCTVKGQDQFSGTWKASKQ